MSLAWEPSRGVVQISALMTRLNDLREQGRMTWNERARGWLGTLTEIVGALEEDGFTECTQAVAASRRDRRPAGGMWQGVNAQTGSVASAIWVARPVAPAAMVFIQIDGEWITRPGRDPDEEEGGEG
jgi:hypothetical protein